MRLTKKTAIELSITLWTWLAETGKFKKAWPKWEKYGDIANECFLCEYDKSDNCDRCPLEKKYRGCCSEECAFIKWEDSETKADRKKYATLFLAQLKELL